MDVNSLKIGDLSENDQVEIIDQDRLCYKVISRSKGAYGIRTISKTLLEEFYKLYREQPNITADKARALLSGQSDIDKFEYGYASTLWQMAKMLDENINNGKSNTLPIEQYSDKLTARQIIYYGAPGTGKSHRIKEQLDGVPKENIFRITFHPDSDYSTFVGAYKPTRSQRPLYGLFGKETIRLKDGEDLSEDVITYKFIPQAFLNAYMQAYRKFNEKVYLIIEEINRGNCAQIFGDLFQLLDRNEYGRSEYTIKADADLKAFLVDEMGKDSDAIKDGELCLPSNLYIYATMNTSDQSLFPIDSAFKRRWDWEYEPIKYKNTDWVIDIQGETYSWVSFQKEINKRIFDATSSEDKMLGDYFVNPVNGVITDKMLLNKILFYLWNDVCKDGEGDIFKIGDTEDVSFSELYGDGGKQKLIGMMNYLGIEKYVGGEINNDINNIDSKTIILVNGQQIKYVNAIPYTTIGEYIKLNPDKTAREVADFWKPYSKYSMQSWIVCDQKEHDEMNPKYADYSVSFECADGEKVWVNKDGWMHHPANPKFRDTIQEFMDAVNAANLGVSIIEKNEE